MQRNTYTRLFAEALSHDAALSTWAAINYAGSGGVNVFVNTDVRRPPSEDDYPMVMLTPATFVTGREVGVITASFWMMCALADERQEIYPGANNVVEYVGGGNLETMREMVVDILGRCDLGDAEIAEVRTESDYIEEFPIFVDISRIVLRQPATLDDPLTL